MNARLKINILEVTRLTRDGRLDEAMLPVAKHSPRRCAHDQIAANKPWRALRIARCAIPN